MTPPPTERIFGGRVSGEVSADGHVSWEYPPNVVIPPGFMVRNEILVMSSGVWVTYEVWPAPGLRARYLRWRYPYEREGS